MSPQDAFRPAPSPLTVNVKVGMCQGKQPLRADAVSSSSVLAGEIADLNRLLEGSGMIIVTDEQS